MKPLSRLVILVLFCALSGISLVAHPASASDELSGYLPKKTLFYASLPDLRTTLTQYKDTAAYRVFQDEEVQDFLEPILGKDGLFEKMMANLSDPLDFDVVSELDLRRVTLAIVGVDPSKDDFDAVQLVLEVWPATGDPAWGKILEWMKGLFKEPEAGDLEHEATLEIGKFTVEQLRADFGTLFLVSVGERTLFSSSLDALTDVLSRFENGSKDSLAHHPDFKAGFASISRSGDDLAVYLGISSILDTVFEAISNENSHMERDQVVGFLDALGVSNLKAVAFCTYFKDLLVESRSNFYAPGEERVGLWKVFAEGAPFPQEHLGFIPKDVVSFSGYSLDLSALWPLFWNSVDIIEPGTKEEMEKELGALEERLSIQLKQDIIDNLTGEVLTYQTMPTFGLSIPSFVFMVGIKDRSRFEPALEALIGEATEGAEHRHIPVGGEQMVLIPLEGQAMVQPCYAFVSDYLILTHQIPALRKAMSDVAKPGEGILASEKFRNAYKSAGVPKNIMSMSYYDVERIVMQAYGSLASLAPMAAGAMEDMPVDLAKLPTPQAISKYFKASVAFTTVEEDGLRMSSASPIGPELYILPFSSVFWLGARGSMPVPQPVATPVEKEGGR